MLILDDRSSSDLRARNGVRNAFTGSKRKVKVEFLDKETTVRTA